MIDVLQKRLVNTPVEIDKAISKIVSYNKTYSENSDAMITFDETGDDNFVILRAVENTSENKAELLNKIKKKRIVDIIKYNLRQAGLDAKIIDKSLYSFLNLEDAETNAEGFKQLIQLSQNDDFLVRDDLCQVIGRFIVHILGKDHPLIERLTQQLLVKVKENPKDPTSPESAIIDIYTKEHPEIDEIAATIKDAEGNESQDALMDMAGYFVGKMINQSKYRNAKHGSGIARIFSRIWNFIKNIFKRSDIVTYKKAIRKAEQDAIEIAQGFMNMEYNDLMQQAVKDMEAGDIESITIEKERKVEHEQYQRNVEVAKDVMNSLQLMVNELRNVDKGMYKKMLTDLSKIQNAYDMVDIADGIFVASQANQAIIECLKFIQGHWNDVVEELNKVNFNDEEDFIKNMGRHARRLSVANTWVTTAGFILDTLRDAVNTSSNLKNDFIDFTEIKVLDEYGFENKINLQEFVGKLNLLLLGHEKGGMMAVVNNARRQFVLRFMKEIVGSDHIMHTTRTLFQGMNLEKEYGKKELLEYIIDDFAHEVHWFDTHFRTMSNNPDIMGQALDKVLKEMKYNGQRNFLDEQSKLLDIMDYADAHKINFDKFYTWTDNAPSGYLIGYVEDPKTKIKMGVDWGKWANDFEEFKNNAKREFKKEYRDALRTGMDAQIAVLWSNFFDAKYKEWHQVHSSSKEVIND